MKSFIFLFLASVITQTIPATNEDELPIKINAVTGGCSFDKKTGLTCDNKVTFFVDPLTPPVECSKNSLTEICLFEPKNTEFLNKAGEVLNENQDKFNATLQTIQSNIIGQYQGSLYLVYPYTTKLVATKTCREAYKQLNAQSPRDNIITKFYSQLIKNATQTPNDYSSPEECLEDVHQETQQQREVIIKLIDDNRLKNERYIKTITDLYRKYRNENR